MPNRKIKHIVAKLVGASTEETLDVYDVDAVHTADIANNLTTTNEGYVLDARQGKALNDSLVGSTYWITSGYFTAASRVEKSGNVKILFLETIGSNTAMNTSNSYVDYFTLPEAYRPKASVLQRISGYAGNTPNYWLMRITSDGVVSLVNYSGVQHPGFEVMVAYI